MAEKIKLVQGDTRPALVVTLFDDTTGMPINLTGSTPAMKFRQAGNSSLRETIVGVVTDGDNGRCLFRWTALSLSGDPGEYEAEIEITFADGSVQTVYDLLKFKLRGDF